MPCGSFWSTPFPALQGVSKPYIGLEIELIMVPSFSTANLLANALKHSKQDQKEIHVLRGVSGSSDEIGSMKEAHSIQKIDGAKVTICHEDTLAKSCDIEMAIESADAIHLIAHAAIPPDDLFNAYVQLGDGNYFTGKFPFIMNNKAKPKLISFSSCQSAKIEDLPSGYDFGGLIRGVAQTGIPEILGAVREVSINVTNKLLPEFYRSWCDGNSAHNSLRDARRALYDNYYQHYVFWEPFVIISANKRI